MNLLDSIQVSRVATSGVTGSFTDAYLVGALVTSIGIGLALLLPRGRTETRPTTSQTIEAEAVVEAISAGA